jgi:hypothetical protein
VVIADFATGVDKLLIEDDNANGNPLTAADVNMVYYNSRESLAIEFGVSNSNDQVVVVVRRGTYSSATGQFEAALNNATAGNDYQVLFTGAADYYDSSWIFGAQNAGGQQAYTHSTHEIILLGESANAGSLNANDIVFI